MFAKPDIVKQHTRQVRGRQASWRWSRWQRGTSRGWGCPSTCRRSFCVSMTTYSWFDITPFAYLFANQGMHFSQWKTARLLNLFPKNISVSMFKIWICSFNDLSQASNTFEDNSSWQKCSWVPESWKEECKNRFCRAVLVGRAIALTLEIWISNPVIGKFYLQSTILKTWT